MIRTEIEERLLKLERILDEKEAKIKSINEDLNPTNEIAPLIAAAAKAVVGGITKLGSSAAKTIINTSSKLGKAIAKAAESGGEEAIQAAIQSAVKSAASKIVSDLPDILQAATDLQEVADLDEENKEQSDLLKQFIEIGKQIGNLSSEMNK